MADLENNDEQTAQPKAQTERAARTVIGLPYLNAYGVITKTLEKIKTATTPDRFTQDFLSTKIGLTGGSPKPVIPFLKRTGFLSGDGAPTNLYKQFRNDRTQGAAAAAALKKGFASLYEINEYAHDLSDKDLKGIVVQATGLETNSKTAAGIVGSFNALKAFANFEDELEQADGTPTETADTHGFPQPQPISHGAGIDLKLGYTINLNLPATSDIAVFNAIFKSLRDNLLN